jgi:hypothetical protein
MLESNVIPIYGFFLAHCVVMLWKPPLNPLLGIGQKHI